MIEIPVWFILVFLLSFLFICIQMVIIYILVTNKQQDIMLMQIDLIKKILSNQKTVILNKDNFFDREKNNKNKNKEMESEQKFDDFSEVSLDQTSLILSDKFNNGKLNKNFESVGLKNEYENEKNSDIVNKLKGIKNVDNSK